VSDYLLDVWIPGTPVTQGSMRHVGHGRMVHAKGVTAWRQTITHAVEQYTGTYFGAWEPLDAPVIVQAVFYLERPKSAKDRPFPHKRQDLDKLARALGDALAPKTKSKPAPSAFLIDDSRIVDLRVKKLYAHGIAGDGVEPGVRVKVRKA
jgi:Holliday junction resolvase RusA-like endonuclease